MPSCSSAAHVWQGKGQPSPGGNPAPVKESQRMGIWPPTALIAIIAIIVDLILHDNNHSHHSSRDTTRQTNNERTQSKTIYLCDSMCAFFCAFHLSLEISRDLRFSSFFGRILSRQHRVSELPTRCAKSMATGSQPGDPGDLPGWQSDHPWPSE